MRLMKTWVSSLPKLFQAWKISRALHFLWTKTTAYLVDWNITSWIGTLPHGLEHYLVDWNITSWIGTLPRGLENYLVDWNITS